MVDESFFFDIIRVGFLFIVEFQINIFNKYGISNLMIGLGHSLSPLFGTSTEQLKKLRVRKD